MHNVPVTGNVARQVNSTASNHQGPAAMASKPHAQKPESSNAKHRQQDVAQTAPKQTHAQLMAELRQIDEPLSVGGNAIPSDLVQTAWHVMLAKYAAPLLELHPQDMYIVLENLHP